MSDNSLALKVVKPIAVTDAMLISTDVPETDYPAYAAGTTYPLGGRVIVLSNHSIYESLQDSNTGHDPLSSPTWWIRVSATNAWKLFDNSNSTQTKKSTSFTYTIKPNQAINALAALNLAACTSLRIRLVDPVYGTVYDSTLNLSSVPEAVGWWEWFFGQRVQPTLTVSLDLPSFPNATLTMDFAGGVDLAVGTVLFGQQTFLGKGIKYGARVGIKDYSRKETNDFGDVVLVQRAFAKRANFDMYLDKAQTDSVQNILSGLRAVPCLWIGSSEYESTILYGIYKDFEVMISYPTYSDCSLEIEGLT